MTHSCARTQISRLPRDARLLPPVAPQPATREEIARLAYAYWEARGRQHGSPDDDWYRAERELLRRLPSSGR